MEAVRDAQSPSERSRLKLKCKDCIAQAERLKAASTAPQQSRELPTAEKNVLLRSSKLHGNLFPPWNAAPPPDAFQLSPEHDSLFRWDEGSPLVAGAARR